VTAKVAAVTALVFVGCVLYGALRWRWIKLSPAPTPSPSLAPAPDSHLAARAGEGRNARDGRGQDGRIGTRRHARSVPAATLLGWHHRTVVCRDGDGRRCALQLRRASNLVEVELPGGHLARLTYVETGELRAALRDVLIDQH